MRILPPFEEKIRGKIRDELAIKPTLSILELRDRLEQSFGREFHFSYIRKLIGKVRNEISHEIDTAKIEPRLAALRENYRLMRDQMASASRTAGPASFRPRRGHGVGGGRDSICTYAYRVAPQPPTGAELHMQIHLDIQDGREAGRPFMHVGKLGRLVDRERVGASKLDEEQVVLSEVVTKCSFGKRAISQPVREGMLGVSPPLSGCF